jgi:hypothetical protein
VRDPARRGLPAWLPACTYHLLLMPGLARKLRLLMDQSVALLFGRDPSSPGRSGSATQPRFAENEASSQPSPTTA